MKMFTNIAFYFFLIQVESVKKDAVEYGKLKLQNMILENAVQVGIPEATNWDSVRHYWRDNGTLLAAARLFSCFYAQFDFKPGWDDRMEREYMALRKYTYNDYEVGKGCFGRIFASYCIQNRRKHLNAASNSTHGHKIMLSRKPGERFLKGKNKKRPKGCTLGGWTTIPDAPTNPLSLLEGPVCILLEFVFFLFL